MTDSRDEGYLSSVQRSIEKMQLFIKSAANVRAIKAEDFANGDWRNGHAINSYQRGIGQMPPRLEFVLVEALKPNAVKAS